jgi:hypothetical protein
VCVVLNLDCDPGVVAGAAKHAVRLHGPVVVSGPHALAAVHNEIDVGVAEDLELAIDHGELEVLSLPGLLDVVQSCADRESGKRAGLLVTEEVAGLHRRAVGVAGEVAEAAHRVDSRSVGDPVAVRAG